LHKKLGVAIPKFPTPRFVGAGFQFYLLAVLFVVPSVAVIYLIMKSKTGLAFRAIRENEQEARMIGINTAKYKLRAFVISTFFAGLAGDLYAHFLPYINVSLFDPFELVYAAHNDCDRRAGHY
jgi:branched-chain amino acid transport system permease protein